MSAIRDSPQHGQITDAEVAAQTFTSIHSDSEKRAVSAGQITVTRRSLRHRAAQVAGGTQCLERQRARISRRDFGLLWQEGVRGRLALPAASEGGDHSLHFPAQDVRRIYDDLARLLRPGGLFLNAEGMIPGPPKSRLTATLREARLSERPVPDTWWDDVAATPALTSLAAERRALLARYPTDNVRHATAERHCRDLRTAGFAEAVIAWRQHDETVVAALR